jgi:hypothetical protein
MPTITRRAMTRRATRDQLAKRDNQDLPDGIGGTITGGPREAIDLMRILERGARGDSRGGAVSGAAQGAAQWDAQLVVSSLGATRRRDLGIALSDGSRISFCSVADAGVLTDNDVASLSDDGARMLRRDSARAPRDTRVLTTV